MPQIRTTTTRKRWTAPHRSDGEQPRIYAAAHHGTPRRGSDAELPLRQKRWRGAGVKWCCLRRTSKDADGGKPAKIALHLPQEKGEVTFTCGMNMPARHRRRITRPPQRRGGLALATTATEQKKRRRDQSRPQRRRSLTTIWQPVAAVPDEESPALTTSMATVPSSVTPAETAAHLR